MILTLLIGLFLIKLSDKPWAPSGSTPIILHFGYNCLIVDPIPDIRPPPPTEIKILSISSTWLHISNPKDAVPCIVNTPSNGWMKKYPSSFDAVSTFLKALCGSVKCKLAFNSLHLFILYSLEVYFSCLWIYGQYVNYRKLSLLKENY